MSEIHSFIAQGFPDKETPALTVVFDAPVPEIDRDVDVEGYRAIYREEAVRLLDAMGKTLPGGLMDALLAELCHRKASLPRVPLTG